MEVVMYVWKILIGLTGGLVVIIKIAQAILESPAVVNGCLKFFEYSPTLQADCK